MATIAISKKIRKGFPMPFLLVILTTALSYQFGFNANLDIAIVGAVPGGFPEFQIPSASIAQLQAILPYAIPIALIGFLESISVSKTYAFQNGYEIDANQELRALGAANAVGGLFGGYVVTGNISRTVVSAQAGAKSQLAELLTASIVLLTVVVLAPLFEFLPKAMLAAMIIVAIIGVVDLGEARRLAKYKRRDAISLIITFLATLIFDVEIGILTGIATSIALHLYHTTAPHTATLGRISGTSHWLDANRHPDAVIDEEVIVIRIDESIYFANAPSLRDSIERAYTRHAVHAKGIVLDCVAINDLDSTAITMFEQVADELTESGTRLCLAGLSSPLHDILEKSGCIEHIGKDNLFLTVHEAVISFGVGEPTEEILNPSSL
jgi:SulP family sulfate permease